MRNEHLRNHIRLHHKHSNIKHRLNSYSNSNSTSNSNSNSSKAGLHPHNSTSNLQAILHNPTLHTNSSLDPSKHLRLQNRHSTFSMTPLTSHYPRSQGIKPHSPSLPYP
jgi:hypothetical protein